MDLITRVANAIQKTPEVAQRRLRFEAQHGRIILRGTVASYFQKQMAQEAVRHVEGVEMIDNELEVVWSDEHVVASA